MDSASSISSMEEIALPDNATPVVSRQGGFLVPDFVHNRNFLTDAECILYCLLGSLSSARVGLSFTVQYFTMIYHLLL